MPQPQHDALREEALRDIARLYQVSSAASRTGLGRNVGNSASSNDPAHSARGSAASTPAVNTGSEQRTSQGSSSQGSSPPSKPARERSLQPVNANVLTRLLVGIGALNSENEDPHAALNRIRAERQARTLPTSVVLRAGWTPSVPLRLAVGATFNARIELEDGGVRPLASAQRTAPPEVGAGDDDAEQAVSDDDQPALREEKLEFPADLPTGYHHLVVRIHQGENEKTVRCPVIVAPVRIKPVGGNSGHLASALPGAQSKVQAVLPSTGRHSRREKTTRFGLSGHLYAVRSERSWGVGDTADLAELATWAAELGADFVHISPINAGGRGGTIEPNPYRPASRIVLDSLAIRPEDIPEVGYLSAAEHQLLEWHGDDARHLTHTPEIDREASWDSKRAAARMVLNVPRSSRRARRFEEFVTTGGENLRRYAIWCLLAAEYGDDWRSWPAELRDVASGGVTEFANEHAADIELEYWLAWMAHEQFRAAQDAAREAGMRIGIIPDLAAGVNTASCDTWIRPEDFAEGFSVAGIDSSGSPASLNLAALRPSALADDGFALWRTMIGAVADVAGGLCVDRASMLFRQWWFLEKGAPREGTFVKFDHEALTSVLLLEAERRGITLVATADPELEPWMADYLRKRGILVTQEIFGRDGELARPESLPKQALVSLLSKDDASVGSRLARRTEGEKPSVTDILTERGYLEARSSLEDAVGAVHRYLLEAPSALVAIRLADLVGESRRAGTEGISRSHDSWRRPLTGPDRANVSLDSLVISRRVKRIMRAVNTPTAPVPKDSSKEKSSE